MRVLLLLTTWLLPPISVAQVPFFDLPLITETSVGRARLGMRFSELRRLYAGCTFMPVSLSQYGLGELADKPDAVLVSKDGRKLFVYFDDYELSNNKEMHTKRLAGLIALHPGYCTKQGIHAGSASGELRRALPTIKVAPSPIPLFDVQEARIAQSTITYVFVGQKELGLPDKKPHVGPVPLASASGRISWIQLCCQ